MSKCLVVILVILGLTSCTTKDASYYQTHPIALQDAMKACPGVQPEGMSCQQLEVVAQKMNSLAYQLQRGPQEFGYKIMALQEVISNQQQQLKTQGANAELEASLAQNKSDLDEHLAIVKWLESPAS